MPRFVPMKRRGTFQVRWFRFGPGLLIALMAVLVLWRQLPPSGDQAPQVKRTRLDAVSGPSRSAPDPAWLLEQREALHLSAPQRQRLSRLRARWDRDTQALRTAMAHASAEFDRGMASRERRSFTLQELQDRAAPVAEYSRQLAAARRAWWDEAATILTAAQRQRAEQAWARRLTPRIPLESDSRQ